MMSRIHFNFKMRHFSVETATQLIVGNRRRRNSSFPYLAYKVCIVVNSVAVNGNTVIAQAFPLDLVKKCWASTQYIVYTKQNMDILFGIYYLQDFEISHVITYLYNLEDCLRRMIHQLDTQLLLYPQFHILLYMYSCTCLDMTGFGWLLLYKYHPMEFHKILL